MIAIPPKGTLYFRYNDDPGDSTAAASSTYLSSTAAAPCRMGVPVHLDPEPQPVKTTRHKRGQYWESQKFNFKDKAR